MPDEIGDNKNVSAVTTTIGGQDDATRPAMIVGRESYAVTMRSSTESRLETNHQRSRLQNTKSKEAIKRIRSQRPGDDGGDATRNKYLMGKLFSKRRGNGSIKTKNPKHKKFKKPKKLSLKSELKLSTERLLENNGVKLAAVSGAKTTLKGKTIDVSVEVHNGALIDLQKSGYEGKKDFSGKRVVPVGKTLVDTSHLGTHSMTPCCPIIMILKKKETDVLSVSLTHCSIPSAHDLSSNIENYREQGFEILKIITGIHEDVGRQTYLRQHKGAKLVSEEANRKNIEYGLIKYEDVGNGAWWISVDVSDNSRVKVDIGNNTGLQ